MSVVCIDFGNESCYLSQARNGGIDTIVNGYGSRDTPSCIAFTKKSRLFGAEAKNQQDLNMENTIYGFKHLLGKKFDDKFVKNEISRLNYGVVKSTTGGIGTEVDYKLNKDQVKVEIFLIPEQMVAMLLLNVLSEVKDDKADVILTVPSYFTSSERQALLDAAQIAKINCLQLLNETTAIALNYGYYKQDEFANQKPRIVAFMDFGHSSLQVSVVAFKNGKLQVLANTSTMIGGRDFDHALAHHFCNEFSQKYNIDSRQDKKAYTRLLAEVQKLKKLMSTNKTYLKLKIDNFMGQMKVESTICREQMEKICQNLFMKVQETIVDCMARSKLEIDKIHSVEITGGSSRIPAFKQMIEEIFSKPPSTTLNQDEAVSKGGAIFCAMKSKFVELQHNIEIIDVLPHNPIQAVLKYQDEVDTDVTILFDEVTEFPFTKTTTLIELNDKKLPEAVVFTNDGRSMTLNSWKFNWSREQIISLIEAEKVSLELTVSADQNGILTLTCAWMEIERKVYDEVVSEIVIIEDECSEQQEILKNEWMSELKLQSDMTVVKRRNSCGNDDSMIDIQNNENSEQESDSKDKNHGSSQQGILSILSVCFTTTVQIFNVVCLTIWQWIQSLLGRLFGCFWGQGESQDSDEVDSSEKNPVASYQDRFVDSNEADDYKKFEIPSLAIKSATKLDTAPTKKYEVKTIERTEKSSSEIKVQLESVKLLSEYLAYQNIELEMKQNDKHETQRSDARNSLEEFIFETRDSIDSIENLKNSADFKANVELVLKFYGNIEKWLYKKGEDRTREDYDQIHEAMKAFDMQSKIKRNNEKFKDDLKVLVAQVNSILRRNATNN